MPNCRREFSSRITRLCAATVLAHRPQFPGSQHRQGRPALAQEQLRGEQVASGEQKQQRSLQASVVFCRLSCLLPEGVAVDEDGDRLTPSVRLAKMVCSWWRLAASATGPGAPGGGSRSWSKSVDVVVDSSKSTWESVPPTRSNMSKNPKMTMVTSKFKR